MHLRTLGTGKFPRGLPCHTCCGYQQVASLRKANLNFTFESIARKRGPTVSKAHHLLLGDRTGQESDQKQEANAVATTQHGGCSNCSCTLNRRKPKRLFAAETGASILTTPLLSCVPQIFLAGYLQSFHYSPPTNKTGKKQQNPSREQYFVDRRVVFVHIIHSIYTKEVLPPPIAMIQVLCSMRSSHKTNRLKNRALIFAQFLALLVLLRRRHLPNLTY